jgi:hypothetical protein
VADLARTRNRVERPHGRAVSRVERLHTSADAVLRAGKARDNQAIVVQRRARDAESLLPAFSLHRPDDGTASLIQCDELAVQLADVDLAVAESQAAARPSAADDSDFLVEIRLVCPQDPARFDADRKYVVSASHDVDDAVMNDRLRLAGILHAIARPAKPRTPHRLELGDVVAVDLREWRVSPVVQIPAVGRPACRRKRNQVAWCERRCRSNFRGSLRVGQHRSGRHASD